MRTKHVEIMRQALKAHPGIVTPRDKLEHAKGITVEEALSIGLTKTILKKLEAHGLAIRGYEQKRGPGGKPLSGFSTRWILISDVEVPNGQV